MTNTEAPRTRVRVTTGDHSSRIGTVDRSVIDPDIDWGMVEVHLDATTDRPAMSLWFGTDQIESID